MEERPQYRIRTLYETVDERFEAMERSHRLEMEAMRVQVAELQLQADLLERSFKALLREISGE